MAYVQEEGTGRWQWVPDEDVIPDQNIGSQYGEISPTEDFAVKQIQSQPSTAAKNIWGGGSSPGNIWGDSAAGGMTPLKQAKAEGFKSVSEKELVMKAQDENKSYPELNWWRSNPDYIDYLKNEVGWDPDQTPDWMGSKKYFDFVKYKADHPSGLAAHSKQAGEAIGTVIGEVSKLVQGVPIVKEVAKPIGSVFKFIGNLIDMPMNMIRGSIAAFGSGHPDEILNNIWQAMKHGATGGTEGQYYSFADAGLRTLIDKYKQGMTDEEYKKFIDSDDFRRTKRRWQMGGLLADLIVDPMWFIGAGESKVMSSFRAVRNVKGELAQLIKNNYRMTNLNKLKIYWKTFEKKGAEFVSELSKDVNAMQDFGLNYDVLKKFMGTTNEVKRQNILSEIMDTAMTSYNSNIRLFDAYGSRVKMYKPFTKKDEVLFQTPIKLEPAKRYLSRWFGGEARQSLRQSSRVLDHFENTWKITDTEHHKLMQMADGKITELHKVLKGIDPKATIENAQELFVQMLESSKVDKEGKVFSKVIGENKEFRIITDAVSVDPEVAKYVRKPLSKRELAQVTGTELTDMTGVTQLLTDQKNLVKGIMQPFSDMNKKLYPKFRDIMDDFVVEWDKQANNLLKMETQMKRSLYDFLKSQNLLHQYPNFAAIIDESRRSRRIWGVNSVVDVKSGKFVHEYISYYPHHLTPNGKRYLDMVEKMEGDALRSHSAQMFYQSERLQWLPTDFTNEHFLKTIFDPDRANMWITRIREGKLHSGMEDKLWFESLARVRNVFKNRFDKKNSRIIKELTGTNLDGLPYKFDDMGVVRYANEDFRLQPLIQRLDAVTINRLSKRGKIFRNFKEDIFQIDPAVLTDRIEVTHKLKGAIEAEIFGLRRGVDEGWLRSKNTFLKGEVVEFPKPTDKYMGMSDWASGDGIFAGYWVPEKFKDTMDSLSKGILKYTEPPDVIKIDRLLQTKPFEMLKRLNQWWKVQVTMKHPAFHARNFFSNRIVMLGEGRSPHHVLFLDDITKDGVLVHVFEFLLERRAKLTQAGKDTNKIQKRIDQLSKRTVNFGEFGREVPIQVAVEEMLRHGVMGNGLTYDIVGNAQKAAGLVDVNKNKTMLEKILKNPELDMPKWITDYNFLFGSKDKWTQAGTKAAAFIEGALGRNELFFHLLRNKGMTIEDAARRVNKVLVDYGAISRGEKILKDYLMPFYTWQSRMIGVMLEKAITQPIMFNKLTQLQNNAYKILELDKAFAPKYEQTGEGMPIVLGLNNWNKFVTGKPLSEIDVRYITAERFLPQAVVNLVDMNGFKDILNPLEFTKKSIEGFLGYAIGNATPFLKTPVEQLIDYSFYFKRPITRYADQTIKYAGLDMSPKVQNVIRSFIGGMKEIDEIVGWFDKNAYTGKPYHTVDTSIVSWLLGGKAYDRNEIREIQTTLGQLRDRYRYNVRDAKNKVFDPKAMKEHARQAVAIQYAIRVLEWYKEYATEFKDKDMFDREQALKILKQSSSSAGKRTRSKNQSIF